ncbi:phospholipase A2 [Pilimelia columellifera]|uniref:Phospholipase A2 n=1 Tax=Pilimelia columellifera subsp. columellifera TaxID=706583 RepID=A0ABN3NRU0_9ACTN
MQKRHGVALLGLAATACIFTLGGTAAGANAATRSTPAEIQTFPVSVAMPSGGHLKPLNIDADGRIAGHVVVADAAGRTVGVVDEPWANTLALRPQSTWYRISAGKLVQEVDARAGTKVTTNAVYNPIGDQGSVQPLVATASSKVEVPSNYVYAPEQGSLHDFCTASPDSWFAADFRGPCARHDMCYENPGDHKKACDDGLLADLRTNCAAAYGAGASRNTCYGTARTYWGAVTAFGDDDLTRIATSGN